MATNYKRGGSSWEKRQAQQVGLTAKATYNNAMAKYGTSLAQQYTRNSLDANEKKMSQSASKSRERYRSKKK